LLSLAAGLAVAEAIEVTADLRVGLKWPNDVLLGDRKVGGILIEGTADATIVGIGINVRVSPEDLPPDLAATATSIHLMAARSVEPADMLAALLERFAVWYRCWLEGGDIVGAWSQRDVLQGRRVAVRLLGEVLQGTADGLESDGALRLKEASGQHRWVRSGDLVFAREIVPDQRNAKGGPLWNPSAPRSP
jgi:BirA family biotin operon repressor/biotin-[acetyl-CoA-carboxylase] ligase